jgi:hypothetical protein
MGQLSPKSADTCRLKIGIAYAVQLHGRTTANGAGVNIADADHTASDPRGPSPLRRMLTHLRLTPLHSRTIPGAKQNAKIPVMRKPQGELDESKWTNRFGATVTSPREPGRDERAGLRVPSKLWHKISTINADPTL